MAHYSFRRTIIRKENNMKHFNFKWLFTACLFIIALFTLNACGDDEEMDYDMKLYVNSGFNTTYFSKVHNDRVLNRTIITNGVVKFPVTSTRPVPKDIKVVFGIDESLLDTYNTEHETEYQLLSQEHFKLINNTVVIEHKETCSIDSVKLEIIDPENITPGNYMVPLSITAISDENIQISSNYGNVYISVSVEESYISLQREPFEGMVAIDNRSEWEFPGASYSAVRMVDEDFSSYWYSNDDPGEIKVKLKQPEEVRGVSMSPFYFYSYYICLLKNVVFDASDDGVTWTNIDKCTMLSPQGDVSNPDIQYIAFKKTNLQYLRIKYSGCYSYYCGIGELNIYK